jgi:hypothetical protein
MARSLHRREGESMTGTCFDKWFAQAGTGESFIYHEGYLPRDRDCTWRPVKGNSADEASYRAAMAAAARVEAEANAAMQASDRGEVMLTQRKQNFLTYSYIATRQRDQ